MLCILFPEVGGLTFPYIKKTTNTTSVLSSDTGVGFCIAYDSENQSNYCVVSFGKKHADQIRIEKIAGNLEVGTQYNNIGTWICNGANTYVVIAV